MLGPQNGLHASNLNPDPNLNPNPNTKPITEPNS